MSDQLTQKVKEDLARRGYAVSDSQIQRLIADYGKENFTTPTTEGLTQSTLPSLSERRALYEQETQPEGDGLGLINALGVGLYTALDTGTFGILGVTLDRTGIDLEDIGLDLEQEGVAASSARALGGLAGFIAPSPTAPLRVAQGISKGVTTGIKAVGGLKKTELTGKVASKIKKEVIDVTQDKQLGKALSRQYTASAQNANIRWGKYRENFVEGTRTQLKNSLGKIDGISAKQKADIFKLLDDNITTVPIQDLTELLMLRTAGMRSDRARRILSNVANDIIAFGAVDAIFEGVRATGIAYDGQSDSMENILAITKEFSGKNVLGGVFAGAAFGGVAGFKPSGMQKGVFKRDLVQGMRSAFGKSGFKNFNDEQLISQAKFYGDAKYRNRQNIDDNSYLSSLTVNNKTVDGIDFRSPDLKSKLDANFGAGQWSSSLKQQLQKDRVKFGRQLIQSTLRQEASNLYEQYPRMIFGGLAFNAHHFESIIQGNFNPDDILSTETAVNFLIGAYMERGARPRVEGDLDKGRINRLRENLLSLNVDAQRIGYMPFLTADVSRFENTDRIKELEDINIELQEKSIISDNIEEVQNDLPEDAPTASIEETPLFANYLAITPKKYSRSLDSIKLEDAKEIESMLIKMGIDTPEKLANYVDEKIFDSTQDFENLMEDVIIRAQQLDTEGELKLQYFRDGDSFVPAHIAVDNNLIKRALDGEFDEWIGEGGYDKLNNAISGFNTLLEIKHTVSDNVSLRKTEDDKVATIESEQVLRDVYTSITDAEQLVDKRYTSKSNKQSEFTFADSKGDYLPVLVNNKTIKLASIYEDIFKPTSTETRNQLSPLLLQTGILQKQDKQIELALINDINRVNIDYNDNESLRNERIASDKRFLAKVHSLQTYATGYNTTKNASKITIDYSSIDALRNYLESKGYKGGELPNFLHNVVVGKILKRTASKMNISDSDLEAIFNLQTRELNGFVQFTSRAVGDVGGLFLNKISVDSLIYKDNQKEIIEYNNEVDRIKQESKGFIKSSDPVVVNNESTVTLAKNTLITSDRNSASTTEVVGAFLDALGNTKNNIEVRLKEFISVNEIPNKNKIQAWLFANKVIKINTTKSQSAYKVDLKILQEKIDDQSLDKFLNERNITDEYIDVRFEEARQQVVDRLSESPDVAKSTKSINLDEFFNLYRLSKNETLESQKAKLDYFEKKFNKIDKGYELDEDNFKNIVSELYIKNSKDEFVKFTSLKGREKTNNLNQFRRNLLGLLISKSRQVEIPVIKFNNKNIVADKDQIYSSGNDFHSLMNSLDMPYLLVNPISVGYRDTGWGRYSKNMFADGKDLPERLREEAKEERQTFVNILKSSKNMELIVISPESDPIAVNANYLPKLHEPFVEFVNKLSKNKNLNNNVLDNMTDVVKKIQNEEIITPNEHASMLRLLVLDKMFVGKEGNDAFVEMLNGKDTEKKLARFRLFHTKKFIKPNAQILDNAIFSYNFALKDKETVRVLRKYKKKNKGEGGYEIAIWDDESKNKVIDEAVAQAKRDNIEWNYENLYGNAHSKVSGYDSISYISKDMMRYLHTLIGHNPNSRNPIKPVVSSNGDSALLYGKTLFMYDEGMQKFFDKNTNIDVLMSSSAVKATSTVDNISINSLEELASGNVLLSKDKIKNISLNSIGILPSKDVDISTASHSISENNFKNAEEESLSYQQEYLDDVNQALDSMAEIYNDPMKQREFAINLDSDIGTATNTNENGSLSYLKSNHYYNTLTRDANPQYYSDSQIQNKLYSFYIDKILNKKRAIVSNIDNETARYGGQAYLVQTVNNRLNGTLTDDKGQIIQRGEVMLPAVERESAIKELSKQNYNVSFVEGKDVFKIDDFIKDIKDKTKDKNVKNLSDEDLKSFILDMNIGQLHDFLQDANKTMKKDYKIGVIVSRKPRTRPNDMALLGLKGFMSKANGHAMQINSLDVVNVFEGDYDADKADYFFARQNHTIDHVVAKQNFFVQGVDIANIEKKKTIFSFTQNFNEQSESMQELIAGTFAWKNAIGAVQKVPRTLSYVNKLASEPADYIKNRGDADNAKTLLEYDNSSIVIDYENLAFFARNALETQYMIDTKGNLNPELGSDLLSVGDELLFPTKDNSILPNDYNSSKQIFRNGVTNTGKRIRIFRKITKEGREENLTTLDKKIIKTLLKEYSKFLNVAGGQTYDNTGTQRKTTYNDVLHTSKDFFEFHKDINRSVFNKLKKEFRNDKQFREIFNVKTRYRFKLNDVIKYDLKVPKGVDKKTITSFDSPERNIFNNDTITNAEGFYEGTRGAVLDRTFWELQDRDMFNTSYDPNVTTGIPRRSYDDWYYKLTDDNYDYDRDLLSAEEKDYQTLLSDDVITRTSDVNKSIAFIKRNKYYAQRVRYNKSLSYKVKKSRIDFFNSLIKKEEAKIEKYLNDTYLKTGKAKDLDYIQYVPIDSKELKTAGVQGSTMSAIKNIFNLGSDFSTIPLSTRGKDLLNDIKTIRKNFYSAHSSNLKNFVDRKKLLSSSTTEYLSNFPTQTSLHDAERQLMIEGVHNDGIRFIYAYMDVKSAPNGIGVLNNKPVRLYNYPSTRFASGLRFLSSYASGNLETTQSLESKLSRNDAEFSLKFLQGIISHYDNFYNVRLDRRGIIDKNAYDKKQVDILQSLKLPVVHDKINKEVLDFGGINWGKTKDKISTGFNLTNNHLFNLYNDIMQLAGKTKEFEEYLNVLGKSQADMLKAETIDVYDFIGTRLSLDSEVKKIAQKVLNSSYFNETAPDVSIEGITTDVGNQYLVEKIKQNPVFRLMGGKSFFDGINLEKLPEQNLKTLKSLNKALDYSSHYEKPSHTGISGYEKYKAKLDEITERCK